MECPINLKSWVGCMLGPIFCCLVLPPYSVYSRECIIPDISRTFHFGVSGNTMNPYFHDRYFKNHVINRQTDVTLKDINR